MARRLRPCSDERGFTLIELLVVILIIGILSAIALPSFINQRGKAQDAEAKTAVRNARTALETFHTDRQSYNVSVADLEDLEPSLRDARNLAVTGTDETFTVSVYTASPETGGTYTITLDANGDATRTCANHGKGGCRATADAAGNYW
jgi:prepilin-type N-terminal cleavage/methylation domain-containing protein